jgi:hypothetical protein
LETALIIIIVAANDSGIAKVIHTLAEIPLSADRKFAVEDTVLAVGSTHVLEAARFDHTRGDLEALDLTTGVAIKGAASSHSQRKERSKAEEAELHDVWNVKSEERVISASNYLYRIW